jgi:serine/threonine-protein kinase
MEDVTRLPERPASAVTTPAGDWGRSGQFSPGTLLAGRFRIVAPLGRGGMGEVYRADDLKLEQTVALKFLPDALVHDPARLAQFHNEVRVARTVSHRNVCRMYDIGDANGRPFLAMEYVDGEDLASLLRRIGRFPQDKAVEVARQLCAGLAAAHERGVLHRDLKPANVMIDGEGHVRITDFGLAALAGSVDNVRAGTPAYMAPEQLAGREVTPRSDLYALGLVLFELFTGKRVFEARTLNELIALHESDSVAMPSSVVRDLEPAVERAILRCLERDPARRPPSALAVSAALPGSDPLAAALAAGETPSPEMVAAAGEQSALRPAVGLSLVGFTLAMLAALAALSQQFSFIHQIPIPRSTDSLRDRARDIIERLGYRDPPPFDSAEGWSFNRDYFSYAAERQGGTRSWPEAPTGRTGTLTFWYRTSPSMLYSSTNSMLPSAGDPPFTVPDMRLIRLDPAGRLVEFHSIPPQREAPSTRGDESARSGQAPSTRDDASARSGQAATQMVAAPQWSPLFEAAGLTMTAFHEVEPRWLPRSESDVRSAWEGPLPDVDGVTARVEGAAYGGRPIFFSVIAPWTQPATTPTAQARPRSFREVIPAVSMMIGALILGAAALLARRNLRTGRGDRRGAFRTAAIVFVAQTAGYLLHARHYASIELEVARVEDILAYTTLSAATVWLLYMALEPYVRRFWPQLLIAWNRLLSGNVRDPLVGRDVLIGVAAGTVGALLIASLQIVPQLLGRAVTPALPSPTILLGTRYAIVGALLALLRSLINALQVVAIVVFLKILVKRNWIVLVLSTLLVLPIAMTGLVQGQAPAVEGAIFVAGVLLVIGVLLRFGLLAVIVTFYTFIAMEIFPLTTDPSRPYAGTSAVVVIAIAAIAAYGFYASRGGEPLFGRTLLD